MVAMREDTATDDTFDADVDHGDAYDADDSCDADDDDNDDADDDNGDSYDDDDTHRMHRHYLDRGTCKAHCSN